MSRGKRYNGSEHKLNIKKVIAVIIAFLVIIMFVAVFIKLMQPKAETTEKKVAMAYYSAFTNNKWGIIEMCIRDRLEEYDKEAGKETNVWR